MWKTYISVVILPRVIDPTYNVDPNRQRESTLIGRSNESKSKTTTLGIGTYCHCSLEAGKHGIRESKSKQIDRQYLPRKKWNLEASYTILSSTLT
jgi:hypothetical protein